MRAPLLVSGQHWHVGVERGRLVYQDDRGFLICPHLACSAAISSTMRGWRSRRCAPPATLISRHLISKPACCARNGRRGCSGSIPARWSRRCRRMRSFGSTADTIPMAAALSPPPWAISRSACASARDHRGYDGEQGRDGVSVEFCGADAPRHRGADPWHGECAYARIARRRRASARHARRDSVWYRSRARAVARVDLTKCRRAF